MLIWVASLSEAVDGGSIALGVGRRESLEGNYPYLALVLAIGIGLLAFFTLMKMRKTFGMKE